MQAHSFVLPNSPEDLWSSVFGLCLNRTFDFIYIYVVFTVKEEIPLLPPVQCVVVWRFPHLLTGKSGAQFLV